MAKKQVAVKPLTRPPNRLKAAAAKVKAAQTDRVALAHQRIDALQAQMTELRDKVAASQPVAAVGEAVGEALFK